MTTKGTPLCRPAASSAQSVLESLTWFGPEALAAAFSAPLAAALCAPGLLVDTIARIYGEAPSVRLRGQPWFAFGQERHIELLVRESVLIEAYSILPRKTIDVCPWLESLGEEALGLALRRHGFVERGPYRFARVPFPLLGNENKSTGSAPQVIARRFAFTEPRPVITVVEVFSTSLLSRLASEWAQQSSKNVRGEA